MLGILQVCLCLFVCFFVCGFFFFRSLGCFTNKAYHWTCCFFNCEFRLLLFNEYYNRDYTHFTVIRMHLHRYLGNITFVPQHIQTFTVLNQSDAFIFEYAKSWKIIKQPKFGWKTPHPTGSVSVQNNTRPESWNIKLSHSRPYNLVSMCCIW